MKLKEIWECEKRCGFKTSDRQERVTHIDSHYNEWAKSMGYTERRNRKIADLKQR